MIPRFAITARMRTNAVWLDVYKNGVVVRPVRYLGKMQCQLMRVKCGTMACTYV